MFSGDLGPASRWRRRVDERERSVSTCACGCTWTWTCARGAQRGAGAVASTRGRGRAHTFGAEELVEVIASIVVSCKLEIDEAQVLLGRDMLPRQARHHV